VRKEKETQRRVVVDWNQHYYEKEIFVWVGFEEGLVNEETIAIRDTLHLNLESLAIRD